VIGERSEAEGTAMGSMHEDWDRWRRDVQAQAHAQAKQQPAPSAPRPPAVTFELKVRNRLDFIRYLRAQGKMRDDCPDCAGTGVIGDGYPCPSCKD
jgi:hypothetical protein